MTVVSPPVLQKPAERYDPRGRLDPAGYEHHASFRSVPPPADLARFIEHFWVVRWEGIEGTYDNAEVMHRPYVDVFVAADDAGIQGTFRGKRIYKASGTGRVFGARFLPGAFRKFWSGELSNLQDQVLPIQDVFSNADVTALRVEDDDLAIERLTALLRDVGAQPDDNVALINRIIAATEAENGPRTVSDVAKAFGRSERWVQQLFRDYIGVGLKWLLQRQRLLAAAAMIRTIDNPDWADIAYALGYASQQHFITDFRNVLGETPVQYKAGLFRSEHSEFS